MINQSKRFEELLEDMKKIHDKKRHDYANEDDIFANFRHSELAGIPSWKGTAIRLGDKFSRLMEFAKKGTLEVKDESIKDTLLDLANYALITHILYEEVQEENRLERVKEWNSRTGIVETQFGNLDLGADLEGDVTDKYK
tara:strand:- start:457 stop:876 length:420 start_codon:yes stop_codon:yes gene_type:complete